MGLKTIGRGNVIVASPFNFLKPVSEEQSQRGFLPKGTVLLGMSATQRRCRGLLVSGDAVVWLLLQGLLPDGGLFLEEAPAFWPSTPTLSRPTQLPTLP